jgi:hypothetical protein
MIPVNRGRFPLLAALLLYTLLKIWFVSGVELGKDEAVYWYWSQHLDAAYSLIPFAVIKLLNALLPGSETMLRLGSVLAGSGSVLLAYLLCRRFGLDSKHCMWGATVFAACHWTWHTSSFLHPDGFLVFFWLLTLERTVAWRRRLTKPRLAVIGLLAALVVLCKYSGAFLASGLFIWLFLAHGPRICYVALLPFLLASSPLAVVQAETLFHLPRALGTLSQIAPESHLAVRALIFLVNPIFFVSPLLLWMLYRALVSGTRKLRENLASELALLVLPALCMIGAFAFFALSRGQIKGNWILPAFLGLWPLAFDPRTYSKGIGTCFLRSTLATSTVQTLLIAVLLKFPAVASAFAQTDTLVSLNTSYTELVSAPDRSRESARSWTERFCEYHGWKDWVRRLETAVSGSDAVPLVSNQYAVAFGAAYYTTAAREIYTVADPRFRDTSDLLHQRDEKPSKVLFVARAGTPIPASLGRIYPTRHQFGELARRSAGCAAEYYGLTLLSR